MPEHALRAPENPHQSAESTKSAGSKLAKLRRPRVAITACAVAGVAALGACSPANYTAGSRAADVAARYIGVPYVYGGSSPAGFDCSGLTQYAYAAVGKYLPRSAEQQYEYVQKIPAAYARKGDLIFFGYPGSIYHVGIYEGNGVIEHAPSPGNVVQYIHIWTSQFYVGRVN